MNAPIDLGVLIPTALTQWGLSDASSVLRFAVRAEQLGYASVWVNDSLLTPRLEALTTLAAIAPLTQRVALGTAALLPVLRRPIPTSQTLASIDRLSNGRLVVAVGAGFPGRFGRPLHEWSDVPWSDRFTRLDETVALWRQLWARPEHPGAFHGDILNFNHLPPGLPAHRPAGPPIWLGGASPAALDRTGRFYDGWLPYPTSAKEYSRGLAGVRAAAAGAGRDPGALKAALFVSTIITDTVERGRTRMAEYAQAVYGSTLDELSAIQVLAYGPIDEIAHRLSAYVAAGARHLVIRIAAADLVEQHQQLEQIIHLGSHLAGAPS